MIYRNIIMIIKVILMIKEEEEEVKEKVDLQGLG
jgi:hypothetical protein